MKKYIIIFLMVTLVFGVPAAVLAEEGIEASAKFMEALVSQLKTFLEYPVFFKIPVFDNVIDPAGKGVIYTRTLPEFVFRPVDY